MSSYKRDIGTSPDGAFVLIDVLYINIARKTLTSNSLANRIKKLITSQEILEKTRTATEDGYLFEQLIRLVHNHYGIDDEFAIELSNQMVRLCQVKNYHIFLTLDTYCRNIIKLLWQ